MSIRRQFRSKMTRLLKSELHSLLLKIKNELEIKTLSVEIDDRVADKLLAFSHQGLELVLRESFNNAKKFHPQQFPAIDVSVMPKDSKAVILSVSDDGQPLPSQELAKVWTPYYQSEKHFTGEIKGMGLGLAMIARLVWGGGGGYRLRNREDRPGVTMELTLPLTEDEKWGMKDDQWEIETWLSS